MVSFVTRIFFFCLGHNHNSRPIMSTLSDVVLNMSFFGMLISSFIVITLTQRRECNLFLSSTVDSDDFGDYFGIIEIERVQCGYDKEKEIGLAILSLCSFSLSAILSFIYKHRYSPEKNMVDDKEMFYHRLV